MGYEQIKLKQKNAAPGARRFKSRSQSLITPLQSPIMQHYRNIGNEALQRMMETGVIQAKLKIGQPNDKYEREADRAADQVMRMPEPKQSLVNGHSSLVQRESTRPECREDVEGIQTKPIAGQITPLIQRQVLPEEEEEPWGLYESVPTRDAGELEGEGEEPWWLEPEVPIEEEEDQTLQSKSTSNQLQTVTPTVNSSINSLKGGGHTLPKSVRSYFEPRFGADFSQVRVHNDPQAAHAARSLNAMAFTIGRDVVFGAGQYSPGSSSGKRLMAHELTHVVQQNANTRGILQRNGKEKTEVGGKIERGFTRTPEERKNNFSFTANIKVPFVPGLKLGPLFFLENLKIKPIVSTKSAKLIPLSDVQLSTLKTKMILSIIRMNIMDRTLPKNVGKLSIGATLGASTFMQYKLGPEGGFSAGIGPTLALEGGYKSPSLRSPFLTMGGYLGKSATLSLGAGVGISSLYKSKGGLSPLLSAEGTAGLTWKRKSGKDVFVKLKVSGEAGIDPKTGKVDSKSKSFYFGLIGGFKF